MGGLRAVILLTALTLAGCGTVAPHTVGQASLQSYKIVAVEVEGMEKVRSWPTQESEFVRATNPAPDVVERMRSEPAFNFPALTAYLTKVFASRVQMEAGSRLPIFSGTRPAKLVIRIDQFDIPSAARRALTDNAVKMKANIDLVDASSGATLLSYQGPFRSRPIIGGLLGTAVSSAVEQAQNIDHGYTMIADYMGEYAAWVMGRS